MTGSAQIAEPSIVRPWPQAERIRRGGEGLTRIKRSEPAISGALRRFVPSHRASPSNKPPKSSTTVNKPFTTFTLLIVRVAHVAFRR